MKLGLDLPAYWPDMRVPIERLLPELSEAARRGEEVGFDSLVLAEHHFIDYFVMPAPLVLAAHLAAVTKRPRIITSIIAIPFHDVRILAGEIAVADHLTQGRLEIGFGSGANQYEFDRMGMPWDASRIELFNEKLKALVFLFTNKDVAYDSPLIKIPPLTILPPPLQKPHPPVWVACVREEAVYHTAKRGFNVQSGSLRRSFEVTRNIVRAFRTGAAEAGATSTQISFGQWLYVAKDDADAKRALELAVNNHKKFVNLTTTPGIVVRGEVQDVPTTDTAESMRDLVIIGTASECVEKLLAHRELGMDHLMLRTHFGPAHAEIMASLDRFGEHVLPKLGLGAARPAAAAR